MKIIILRYFCISSFSIRDLEKLRVPNFMKIYLFYYIAPPYWIRLYILDIRNYFHTKFYLQFRFWSATLQPPFKKNLIVMCNPYRRKSLITKCQAYQKERMHEYVSNRY